MGYIKINVIGGGQILRFDSKRSGDLIMNLTQHENGEEGLQLVRPRAIRGIFSYLLGETRKLFQSNEPSEIPLFNDEEREELFAKARIKLTERPWFSWFFARRDFHKKASSYIVNSKISVDIEHNIWLKSKKRPSASLRRPFW